MAITISAGLPVHVWRDGEVSHNQSTPDGIDVDKFCIPYKCTDRIPFQITDTDDVTYYLSILDKDGIELERLTFTKTMIATGVFAYDIAFIPEDLGICDELISAEIYKSTTTSAEYDASNFFEEASNDTSIGTVPWDLDDNDPAEIFFGSGPFPGTIGNRLDLPFNALGGMVVDYEIEISTGSGLRSYDVIFESFNGVTLLGSTTITITAPNGSTANHNGSVVVPATGPSDALKIRVVHAQETFSAVVLTNIVIASQARVGYTDGIDVATEQPETVLLTYTNGRNYAGLKYGHLSPEVYFQLRLPAIFYQDRTVDTSKTTDLSSGEIIDTSSEIKFDKLLELGHIPNHLHRTIVIALSHTYKDIDGLAVTKTNGYEKAEGRKTFSSKTAKIWLTERDTVIRNVI